MPPALPRKVAMFPFFSQLPQELRTRIIHQACLENGIARSRDLPIAPYLLTINRDWQEVIETYVFTKVFTLQPEHLGEFERIVTSRRARLITGVFLHIDLNHIDVEWWVSQSHGAEHTTTSITHWFPDPDSDETNDFSLRIKSSIAVTNIFARLFQIMADWPCERSSAHLMDFKCKVHGFAVFPHSRASLAPRGWPVPSASRPMLICDFSGLPEVASIGKFEIDKPSVLDCRRNLTVIHPHTTLTLLKRMPRLFAVAIGVGSGVEEDRLADAINTFRLLPSCAPQLKILRLHLLEDYDCKEDSLIPDMNCAKFQALSTSVLELTPSLPSLEALELDCVVNAPDFFSSIVGMGPSRYMELHGARPRWPNLRLLWIHGYYDDQHDDLLTDPESKNKLFVSMGKALDQFPELSYLKVMIEHKPLQPAEAWIVSNNILAINLRRGYLVIYLFRTRGSFAAQLRVDGITPSEEDLSIWTNFVLRKWHGPTRVAVL